MIYWYLSEDFGGYSYGTVTEKESLPAGATVVSSESDLQDAVKKLEKAAAKAFDDEQKFLDKIEKEANEAIKVPPGQEKKDLNQSERRRNNG